RGGGRLVGTCSDEGGRESPPLSRMIARGAAIAGHRDLLLVAELAEGDADHLGLERELLREIGHRDATGAGALHDLEQLLLELRAIRRGGLRLAARLALGLRGRGGGGRGGGGRRSGARGG